jgi:hypothetical protein
MTYQPPAGISILGTETPQQPAAERLGKDVYYTKAELGSDGIDKHWTKIQSGEMVLCDTIKERDRLIVAYNPHQGGPLPAGISML